MEPRIYLEPGLHLESGLYLEPGLHLEHGVAVVEQQCVGNQHTGHACVDYSVGPQSITNSDAALASARVEIYSVNTWRLAMG